MKNENRVVFMGNSITANWQQYFASMFPGKPYIGRGISGQTTPQMLVRFRQDVIALEPAVVVILAGTNDIAGNTGPATLEMIEGNIASMAEMARANGLEVVLASVLPVRDYPWKPGTEDHCAQCVDERLRRATRRDLRRLSLRDGGRAGRNAERAFLRRSSSERSRLPYHDSARGAGDRPGVAREVTLSPSAACRCQGEAAGSRRRDETPSRECAAACERRASCLRACPPWQ